MDHAATMRNTYERINAGDIAGFGDLVADDFVEHQGGPGLPATKEGTLEFFRVLLAAFPDMRMTVEDLIASGDKTVARVRVMGTHKGEFMGCRRPARAWTCSSSTSCGSTALAWSVSTGASRTCCRSCSSSAWCPPALRHSPRKPFWPSPAECVPVEDCPRQATGQR